MTWPTFVEGATLGVCDTTLWEAKIEYLTFGDPARPQNQWITVSVADKVPEDTKAVFLCGIGVITNGFQNNTTTLKCWFKRTGYQLPPAEDAIAMHWDLEAAAVNMVSSPTDGSRNNFGLWVPLDANRCFDLQWCCLQSTSQPYPQGASVAWNIRLNAYLR